MRSWTWFTCGALGFFLAAPQISTSGPKAGPASPPKAAGPAVFSASAGNPGVSAEAELERDRVAAVLNGVVSSLDVYPGVVARPGTTVWGEIVDLRELDVRCELSPDEADRVAIGQAVEVRPTAGKSLAGASIVFVGPVADAKTGRVSRRAKPSANDNCRATHPS